MTPFARTGLATVVLTLAAQATAQTGPNPGDVTSPEAIVQATYEAIQRAPGADYDWARMRPLVFPQTLEIPNTEQTGGKLSVHSPNEFQRIVDSYTTVGGANDKGFQEEQTHAVIHQYGDVAKVFSTYQKHFWGEDQILGRGINAFQLVRQPDGQWRVVSIVWDEESGAGPIPESYGGSGPATSTGPLPGPEDFSTPEAIVAAAYACVQRAPGETYDWARFRSLFLPQAVLISNPEQRGGVFEVQTPGEFIAMADAFTTVGGPNDRGFAEREIHSVVERYGDIAQVFSTYEKRFVDSDQVLGRGINSFQLLRFDGRWWIVGIVWDEESGAGPIPSDYR